MRGGVKFYRGGAKSARNYVEKDCARYDDYYLADGDGIAMRFVAGAKPDGEIAVEKEQDMDGETYEARSPGWSSRPASRRADCGRIRTGFDSSRSR